MLNPTIEQKQKHLIDLACMLTQHTKIKVLPTWFCGCESDEDKGESYEIAWENDKILASIQFTESVGIDSAPPNEPPNNYGIWVFILEHNEETKNFIYTTDKFIFYDNVWGLSKNPIITGFVNFVNENFKE